MAKKKELTVTPLDSSGDENEKKNRNDKKQKKEKNRKRWPLILAIILILIIGLTAAVIVLNPLGLGEKYILSPLRGIPFIGSFIPEASGENPLEQDSQVLSVAADELQREIERLQGLLDKAQSDLEMASELNTQYEEQINLLRAYRDLIEAYNAEKLLFDTMIAENDPNAFINFYESIAPENLNRLIEQAIISRQDDTDFKRFAATYADMDPESAAAVFEQMLATSPDLLVRILRNIDASKRAAIYNEMTERNVARIAVLMAPTPTPVTSPSPSLIPTPTPVPTINIY